MPTARTRLARRIIPFVLVVLAIVLVTFSMRAQAQVESAQSQSSDRSVAVQEFAQRATQPVRDLIGWFGDVRTARQERDLLAQENAVLRSDLAKAEVNQQDGEELRGLLGYVRSPAFPQIKNYQPRAARVVARSPSLTSSSVVVDAATLSASRSGIPCWSVWRSRRTLVVLR